MPETTEQASKPSRKWLAVLVATVVMIWFAGIGVACGPYRSLPVGPVEVSPTNMGMMLTIGMIGIWLGIAMVIGRVLPLGEGRNLTGSRAKTVGVICLICSSLLFLTGLVAMMLMLISRYAGN